MLQLRKLTYANEKDFEYFNKIELGTNIFDIKDVKNWKLDRLEKYDGNVRLHFTVEAENAVGYITFLNNHVETVNANIKYNYEDYGLPTLPMTDAKEPQSNEAQVEA